MGKPWVWIVSTAAFAAAAQLYVGLASDWASVARAWPSPDGTWGDPEIRTVQAALAAGLALLCALLSGIIGILTWRRVQRRMARNR